MIEDSAGIVEFLFWGGGGKLIIFHDGQGKMFRARRIYLLVSSQRESCEIGLRFLGCLDGDGEHL